MKLVSVIDNDTNEEIKAEIQGDTLILERPANNITATWTPEFNQRNLQLDRKIIWK